MDYSGKRVVHFKGYGLRIDYKDERTKQLADACLSLIEELRPDVLVVDGDWYYTTSFTHIVLLLSARLPNLKVAVFSKEKNVKKFQDSWVPTGVRDDLFVIETLDNGLAWDKLGTIAFQKTKSTTAVCFGGGVVVGKEYQAACERASDGTDPVPVTFHWFPVERLNSEGTAVEGCALAGLPGSDTLVKHDPEPGPALTVMIPLGGLGSRFAKEGYTMRTKPFVRVLGKEMILWLTDNLNLREDDVLVIVYNPAFANIKVCMECLLKTKLWDRVRFVELEGPTRGAAETVLLGLQGLPPDLQARPTVLCDGDTFYTADVVSKYRVVAAKGRNGVFCFPDDQEKPIYSYVKVPDRNTNVIVDIKEKQKISDLANSGCYCFADGRDLAKYCITVIEGAMVQQSQDGVGEFYTSGVIKAMLDDGKADKKHVFQAIELSKSDMKVLGTPAQVAAFCKEWPTQPALRFVFDLDNTLCTSPVVSGDYSTCLPIAHTIAYLRQVKSQGHTVVIATARRMRTHKHNVAAVVADIGKITMDWLAENGVEYDEIFFGKPWGHFYIDDLAICPFQGSGPEALAKQTGFYPTSVQARASQGGAGPGVVLRESEKATAAATASPASKNSGSAPPSSLSPAPPKSSPTLGFWAGLLVGVAVSVAVGAANGRSH